MDARSTVTDPEERIRIFILNHLEYFVSNQQGLKVLSHEDDSLENGLRAEIAGIKREYYRICLGLMEDLRRTRGLDFNVRTAVMSLFGMINWIYTWYNPRVDGNAETLAGQMSNIVPLTELCTAASREQSELQWHEIDKEQLHGDHYAAGHRRNH